MKEHYFILLFNIIALIWLSFFKNEVNAKLKTVDEKQQKL
jgi:hypothetical protein